MPNNTLLIAGQHCGKKIQLVPSVKPAYLALEAAAKNGSHWARITVSGLQALSSGRLDKNNIFIRPNNLVVRGQEQFFAILPGCKATVERLPDDTYKVVELVMDAGYFELDDQNSMTGLYKANKAGVEWTVKHLADGNIIPDNGAEVRQRIVGISDTKYPNAFLAARGMVSLISRAPGAGGVFFNDFDLHFTAGFNKALGSLKRYRLARNPLANESIYGSALMLATSMYTAKNLEGISWVSESGGSAVLTQAMRILADQGVILNRHTAFLSCPSTNVKEATVWAHKIGLDISGKFVLTSFDYFISKL